MKKDLEALRLFNTKVEKLQQLSFTKTLLDKPYGLTLSWSAERGRLETTRHGPHHESIDAFVLTIRLFRQDNDVISVRNIASIYNRLPVSTRLRDAFAMHRTNLNQYLDDHSWISINGQTLSRRDIFETFLYGNLSHLDEAKRELFRQWEQVPPLVPMLENEFVSVLGYFLSTLRVMAEINRLALEELDVNGPGSHREVSVSSKPPS